MPSDRIARMLASSDKEMEKATGVLARLARRIMQDRGINYWQWNVLMEAYLDNPRNLVPNNTRDRSSARGNLNKELDRPTMTWKVFDKFLRFIGAVHVRFEVHLTMPDKKTTIHGINIRLSDSDIPTEEDLTDDADTPAD